MYLDGFCFVYIAVVRFTGIMHQSKIYGYLYGFPHNSPAGLKHVGIKQRYQTKLFVHLNGFYFVSIAIKIDDDGGPV